MTKQGIPRRTALSLALWLFSGGLLGCEDKIIIQAPTAPDPPQAIPDRLEFRVLGNLRAVTVRHVNQQDGTSVVRADLPYFASFTTLRDSMFLSLEAWASGSGWLQVQIVVNGYLLQEATTSEDNPRLSIAVTYRRGQYPAPLPVPALEVS